MRTEAEWNSLEAERNDYQNRCICLRRRIEIADWELGELSARVQGMREALVSAQWAMTAPLDEWKGPVEFNALKKCNAALATPDTSAQILARRDAAIWMEAAEVLKQQHTFLTVAGMTSEQLLRAKADELLKGLEKGQ